MPISMGLFWINFEWKDEKIWKRKSFIQFPLKFNISFNIYAQGKFINIPNSFAK